MNGVHLDPRIGCLNGGRFYAYINGYANPPTIGTLSEIESALGVPPTTLAPMPPRVADRTWSVTMRFEHPAWDEIDGIEYTDIIASSKAEANQIARKRAQSDGHTGSGKGRYFFSAKEI